MGHRVSVDNDLCLSSGRCVADLPGVFRFDDDELAEVIPGAELPSDARVLATVARNCPAGAIQVRDGDDPAALA